MFNGFMANADLSFGVLGTELWSPAGLGLARQALRRFGRRGMLAFAATVLVTGRDWLGETFESEAAHGLLAPWVLHTGLGPDQAASGFMTQVIACALQLGGMPVPKGGGVKLVDALAAIVRDAGGELRTERRGRARARLRTGARRRSGSRTAETIPATQAVVASVTPTQLYGRLLGARRRARRGRAAPPAATATAAARCRSTSRMSEQPDWYGDERLGAARPSSTSPPGSTASRAR